VNFSLDTSAVVAILRDNPPQMRRRLRRAMARGASISISSVALYELWHGVARSARRSENAERLRAFLAGNVTIEAFDEEDAAMAGELRARLESAGRPIGPYDLMIAAQALVRGTTVVTANVAEFSRVQGLAWQNWSAQAPRRSRNPG
jgi:tRNA(fMet)-specific endonuclease VapC